MTDAVIPLPEPIRQLVGAIIAARCTKKPLVAPPHAAVAACVAEESCAFADSGDDEAVPICLSPTSDPVAYIKATAAALSRFYASRE